MKKLLIITVLLMNWPILSQPNAPIGPDAPCESEPGANSTDTVVSNRDSEGYFSMFNGVDFTGWWQSCESGHSSNDREKGGIFRVDPVEKAIYTTTRNNAGGLLMTNKKHDHYEMYFETWPDYGNDAGIFHRSPPGGRCFQTVLDYISGGSYGGTWGEGGYAGRDFRPMSFSGSEEVVSIPGNSKGSDFSNWTLITKNFDPISYDCDFNGCLQEDWQRLWDFDGWNEFKIQFYDGLEGINFIKMKSWFRKMGAGVWVPVLADTTLKLKTPAFYIGIQIHGGGRFGAPKGSWYRNLRWKPLDKNGVPIYPVVSIQNHNVIPKEIFFHKYDLKVSINKPGSHRIKLLNAQGKVIDSKTIGQLEIYSTGNLKISRGVLFLQVETGKSKYTQKYIVK